MKVKQSVFTQWQHTCQASGDTEFQTSSSSFTLYALSISYSNFSRSAFHGIEKFFALRNRKTFERSTDHGKEFHV